MGSGRILASGFATGRAAAPFVAAPFGGPTLAAAPFGGPPFANDGGGDGGGGGPHGGATRKGATCPSQTGSATFATSWRVWLPGTLERSISCLCNSAFCAFSDASCIASRG
jgi:hypothetical protein